MKLLIVFSIIFLNASFIYGQVFKGFSYEELARPAQQMAMAHNQAANAINQLYSYVVDVLGHDIDAQLRQEMNANLKSLDILEKQLSDYGYSSSIINGYNSIYRKIQKEITEYNDRVAKNRDTINKESDHRDDAAILSSEPQEWSGTGFALKDSYIVTNFHVVDRTNSIVVYGIDGDMTTGYSASVVATDRTNDLAIIRISDSRFDGFSNIPYSINNQIIDVGEDVWVLGYPLTQVLGNEVKLTNGVVSSRSGYHGDLATYQISAPVQPGSSGGPLFDSKGNIVGIVNSGVPGAENVGYAIKTSYLKNLVDSYSIAYILPANNTISTLPLKDQVKKVKNFVFLLLCSSITNSSTSSSTSSSSKISSATSSSINTIPSSSANKTTSNNSGSSSMSNTEKSIVCIKEANAAFKEQNWTKAIMAAENANSYEENSIAYLIIGQASIKLGKDSYAIKNFEKYLELKPNASNANGIIFTVAALYQGQKNNAKALEYYKKVQNDPKYGAQAKQMIAAINKYIK